MSRSPESSNVPVPSTGSAGIVDVPTPAVSTGQRSESPPLGTNQRNASAGTLGFGRIFMRWMGVITSSFICVDKFLSCFNGDFVDDFDLDNCNDNVDDLS